MIRPRTRRCPITLGWDDYITLLTDADIWPHFTFTGKFVLATSSFNSSIGLAVAYAFQTHFKGREFCIHVGRCCR